MYIDRADGILVKLVIKPLASGMVCMCMYVCMFYACVCMFMSDMFGQNNNQTTSLKYVYACMHASVCVCMFMYVVMQRVREHQQTGGRGKNMVFNF